jgi:RNA polymerase sigma factor (sigma-70 family)
MSISPGGQVPAQRSKAEFEQLFRESFRPLVGMALSLHGITPEEAEDAAEAALEEVLRRWARLDNPRAYAYKATISNVLKIKRKQAGYGRALRCKARLGDFQPEAHEDPGLMEMEYRQWVMTILDSLPPAQREAVALCLVDELSPAEAGELLGKTGAALRQALHAGREALRRHIAGEAAAEAATVPAPKVGAGTIPAAMAGRKEVR